MTIDERIEFLLKSTESLHASLQEVHASLEANAERWADLVEREEKRSELIDGRFDKLTTVAESLMKIVLDCSA